MTETGSSQQLFDLWRKQLEDGAQAWSKLLSQPAPGAAPPTDPMAFWRPIVDQWVQASARAFAQTPMTPDVMAQWKQFLDQSIEAWSRALGEAMNTEAFAQLLGRYLDQWLVASAPVKKATDQAIDQALQTLNLASRTQLTSLAGQIVALEERVERIEEAVNAVLKAVQREPR
jgi:polyhydroxyalkanoate synthesis regulator phasin